MSKATQLVTGRATRFQILIQAAGMEGDPPFWALFSCPQLPPAQVPLCATSLLGRGSQPAGHVLAESPFLKRDRPLCGGDRGLQQRGHQPRRAALRSVTVTETSPGLASLDTSHCRLAQSTPGAVLQRQGRGDKQYANGRATSQAARSNNNGSYC